MPVSCTTVRGVPVQVCVVRICCALCNVHGALGAGGHEHGHVEERGQRDPPRDCARHHGRRGRERPPGARPRPSPTGRPAPTITPNNPLHSLLTHYTFHLLSPACACVRSAPFRSFGLLFAVLSRSELAVACEQWIGRLCNARRCSR